jgi:bacterioferritin
MTESNPLSSDSAFALSATHGLAERKSLLKLLNEALGVELECSLRRRNRQAASAQSGGAESAATMGCQVRPDFELANRLAERITRLGGYPELALAALDHTGVDPLDTSISVDARFFRDLASERAAAALHRKLLARLAVSDPGTSGLLGELLLANESQLSSLCELRWPNQAQHYDQHPWLTTASTT